jgi:hypothetical protein
VHTSQLDVRSVQTPYCWNQKAVINSKDLFLLKKGKKFNFFL